MAKGAAGWAARRNGSESAEPPQPQSKESGSGPDSVSSASSESFEDDKFHLPLDHKPLLLLQGWDQPPPPPPPSADSGSGSGSESGGESKESSSESGSGPPGAPGEEGQPPAPPPRIPGFSCRDCAMFKALGNGTFGCESEDYHRWSGTDRLVETKSGRPVLNPERACSDWFSPATGAGAQPIPTRHNAK